VRADVSEHKEGCASSEIGVCSCTPRADARAQIVAKLREQFGTGFCAGVQEDGHTYEDVADVVLYALRGVRS
jgi:hypothetical protein